MTHRWTAAAWSLAWALVLWLPVLAWDLTGPLTARHLRSPSVLRAFLLGAALLGTLATVPWALGLAWERLGPWAPRREGLPPGTLAAAGSALTAAVVLAAGPAVREWARAAKHDAFVEVSTRAGLGLAVAMACVVALSLAWPARIRPVVGRALPALAALGFLIMARPIHGHGEEIDRAWTALLLASAGGLALAALVPRLRALGLAFAVVAPVGTVIVSALPPTLPQPEAAPPESAPDVIVVVIDTLRADHTGLGGYSRDTTPRLDALGEASGTTVFERAIAPATSTAPSVKGMFTSAPPSVGGWTRIGDDSPRTMAETFRAAGYRTGIFSANGVIHGHGYQRGFDTHWVAGSWWSVERMWPLYELYLGSRLLVGWEWARQQHLHLLEGDVVRQLATSWLGDTEGERPRFLWLQLVEPHWPYYDRGHGFVESEPSERLSYVDLIRLPNPHRKKRALRDTHAARDMIDRYDEGVREADAILERFLDDLDRGGVLDEAIVVVTADHGEEFFEHGGFSHGHDIYPEQAHVPLVIRWPRSDAFEAMPERVTAPVSTMGLLPTFADLLDLDPDPRWQGRSLLGALAGQAEGVATTEGHVGRRWRFGRYEESFLARTNGPPRGKSSRWRLQLYDLHTDPAASRTTRDDVPAGLGEHARDAARRRWRAIRTGRLPEPPPDATRSEEEEAIEHLRALGYVE